jgi:hypothetical protein
VVVQAGLSCLEDLVLESNRIKTILPGTVATLVTIVGVVSCVGVAHLSCAQRCVLVVCVLMHVAKHCVRVAAVCVFTVTRFVCV